MATVAEIKDLKREQLDALAVEQGLDPAQFAKVEDLRAELLKTADDAEPADDSAEDDTTPGVETDPENPTTDGNAAVNNNQDAENAANAAETPTLKPSAAPFGHAGGFDKYGNPVFGKVRASK